MRFLTRPSVSSAPRKSREVSAGSPGPPAVAASAVPASRYLSFLTIAALGCALDLATKHVVFQWRGVPRQGNVWWIWEGYVGIETAVNTGALFGLGHDQVLMFALISVAAIIGILYWLFVAGAARDLYLAIALGCVFGGILGNLYDRLGFWGQAGVRDWILLCYGRLTWPNFNIADSLLVCGAGLLVWHGFRAGHTESAAAHIDPR